MVLDLISHHDPLLHGPAPYSTLIHTSYPCQSTPHTQGIPSLSSSVLVCTFFNLPVHFCTPMTSFCLAPQPAPIHPPIFILTPCHLGTLSAIGTLCAHDDAPRFHACFAPISKFSNFDFKPISCADTAQLPVHFHHPLSPPSTHWGPSHCSNPRTTVC